MDRREQLDAEAWKGEVTPQKFYQSLLNESFWQNPCRSQVFKPGNSITVDAQVIKPKLSDEQKRQLKMTFNLMDADGGGTIDGRALTPGPSLPLN